AASPSAVRAGPGRSPGPPPAPVGKGIRPLSLLEVCNMSLVSFLRRWFRRSRLSVDHRPRAERRRSRPRVEALEERSLPAAGPRAGVAAFLPASASWYLRGSPSPGAPDVAPFAYGGPAWQALAGDWGGDGRQSVGVFDPATATWYLKDSNSAGAP